MQDLWAPTGGPDTSCAWAISGVGQVMEDNRVATAPAPFYGTRQRHPGPRRPDRSHLRLVDLLVLLTPVTAVPVPAALPLMAAVIAGFGLAGRRRMRVTA